MGPHCAAAGQDGQWGPTAAQPREGPAVGGEDGRENHRDHTARDIFPGQLQKMARDISIDPTHPGHALFSLLPSGKKYHTLRSRTTRLLHNFFHQAVKAITSPLLSPPDTD